MRSLVLCVALVAGLSAAVGAQCTATVQKLVDDRKFDDARTVVQTALKKNDKDDVSLHCMGRIYVAEDKAGESQKWFERAVDANDKVAVHHLWLGNAIGEQAQKASKLKQPFMAKRIKSEFEKAVQLDPALIDARHGLIQFYSQAPGFMGGSMDKAKEQAREIGKLNAWRGHWEMAQLLERDKDVAGAEKEFMAAVTAAPDSNLTYLFLGSFQRRQKKWSEALATYETLLKRKPDAVNVHLNVAYTLYQSGQDLAREERETRLWIEKMPSDASKQNQAVAHFLLGHAAEKQGKKDVAKSEYQQAVSLYPANNDAKKALEALK
jgi:tetratricopeptide (TPR) repeat protein